MPVQPMPFGPTTPPGPVETVLRARRSAAPWLLICLVLISVLGTHFLRGHDSAGHHRVLIPVVSQDRQASVGAVPDDALGEVGHPARTAAARSDGTGSPHDAVAGWAVLVLMGLGAAALCALLRRSCHGPAPTQQHRRHWYLRGPPTTAGRLMLCVERT